MSEASGAMVAMTHEYDGGLCWCGPKCDPPTSPSTDTDRSTE